MKRKNNPRLIDIIDDKLNRFFSDYVYKNWINSLELNNNEKIIELGCGSGNLSKYILNKIPNGFLTGVDISEYFLSNARKRFRDYDNIELLLGEIPDLDIKNNSYDRVIIHYVLHDIPCEKRFTILETLSKKLKENRKICLREPTRKNHRMPLIEINHLMEQIGFKAIHFEIKKPFLLGSLYEGIFTKY